MAGNSKAHRRAPDRPFPAFGLEDCVQVARAIQESNAGRPMNRLLLAQAIGRTPGSSEYRVLLSSSFKYGLTIGTEKSAEVQLTELGTRLTKPTNETDRRTALREAAMAPELFARVYTHYDNAKLPSGEFFRNTLERQFSVPSEYAAECEMTLQQNGKFAEILIDISGVPHVMLSARSASTLQSAALSTTSDRLVSGPDGGNNQSLVPIDAPESSAKIPRIFIGHGKNTVPLDQIKGILEELGVPYRVALEEPNTGRPISEKVAEIMRECTSGIFIFSADEKVYDENGTALMRPSENVVFELGAGSMMFGNRIVIFKEDGVSFPTDFRDIGHISFESQKLNAKATELIRELVGFGILKISAA